MAKKQLRKTTEKTTRRVLGKKSQDVPATAKMVDQTRSESKSDITTLRLEMRSGFKSMESRFGQIDSQMSELKAMFHRMMAMMEEQHAHNIYVLDGYSSLEARLSALEAGMK